jgi:uncharacterized protein (TIGR00251 family)
MSGHIQLRVRVTPNAARSEVLGWDDDPLAGRVLRLRIAAPPVDGKANTALRDFLAEILRVPKSQVRLAKGSTARIKTFTIPIGSRLPE